MHFERAYERTMRNEGFYSDHKLDKGGETYRGISRRFHPAWKGWEIVDTYQDKSQLEKNKELEELVKKFYLITFFNANRLQYIDCELIACKLFDLAVNAGNEVAGKLFQRAMNFLGKNLVVDGEIGQKTIQAYKEFNSKNKAYCLEVICGLQINFYVEITEKDSPQKVFSHSWIARV